MKIYLSCFLLLTLLFSSCIKDDTGLVLSLPAKTQTGQNTFGFLFNSSVWTNYGQVCFPFAGGCRENLSGIYFPSTGRIIISADKVLKKNGSWNTSETLNLSLPSFRDIGTYSTRNNDTLGVGYSFSEIRKEDKTYILSQVNPTFTITVTKIDTIGKIMSGEFSGILFRRLNYSSFETSLTDSIVVSDGRFDIKLK